jgi:ribosomal protein S18 acetylase RimI-like enzyme
MVEFDFMLLISHVITGTIGALVLWSGESARRVLRNRAFNRKYPIAGSYIAHTEDLKEGVTVVFSSFVTLHQHGKRIEGVDRLKDGARSWKLEASIVGAGHVSGFYAAEAMGDEGVGVFYLRTVDGDLEGFWSGYDHVNKSATSGRYIYRRLRDIEIVLIEDSHKTGILSVASSQFGPGYVSESDLEPGPDRSILVALLNQKVSGFVIGEVANLVSLYKVDANLVAKDVLRASTEGKLGIIKTIAVAGDSQGHGIGERLFAAMERILQRRGAEIAAVPAWKTTHDINLRGILDNNGYEPFLELSRYWKDGCDRSEFKCGERQSDCVCDLVWYKKSLALN